MRSGTNWVGNLLNLHPKVICTGEFYFDELQYAFQSNIDNSYSLLSQPKVNAVAQEEFKKMVKACILSACESTTNPKVRMFGDRTPRDIEPVLLDGSYQILVVRDPRDVMISWAYHLLRIELNENSDDPHIIHFDKFPKMYEKRDIFRKDQTFFKSNPPSLLSDNEDWVRSIARKWDERMRINMLSIKKINSGKLDAKVIIARYEDLHQNIEKERERLYRFLGLDPNEASPINKLTLPGFKTENFNSHYRKGIIGDWKKYFTSDVATWFHEEAGQSLAEFSYECDSE